MEVEEWPVPNESYSLSLIRGPAIAIPIIGIYMSRIITKMDRAITTAW